MMEVKTEGDTILLNGVECSCGKVLKLKWQMGYKDNETTLLHFEGKCECGKKHDYCRPLSEPL